MSNYSNNKQLLNECSDLLVKLNESLDKIHDLGYEITIKVTQLDRNSSRSFKRPLIEIDATNALVNQG